MKLIILRHGETVDNANGIIQGHLPGKLNDNGIAQAEKVGERLKSEKIDAIYCSDLRRAVETAERIIKHHPGVPVEYTEDIREIKKGEHEGKKKTEVDLRITPKGGETKEELYDRAGRFIERIFEKHPKGTVLVVTHGTFGRAAISWIIGSGPSGLHDIEKLKNTSVNIFELMEDRNHKIHLMNCTNHLE